MKISLLIFYLLFFNLKLVFSFENQFPFLAEITTQEVNVRAGQSVNFEKLCVLKKGEEVIVVDKSYSWFKVKLPPTAKTYISEKYVKLLRDDQGQVIGDKVNVRAGAGYEFTSLGQLFKGEKVKILEKLEGWYHIKPILMSYGWIKEDFLVFKSKISDTQINRIYLADSNLDRMSDKKTLTSNENGLSQNVKQKSTASEYITVEGYLAQLKVSFQEDIQYQLIESGQTTYYVQGFRELLDHFVNLKVKVEGRQMPPSPLNVPIIVPSRIQLIL